MEYTDDQAFNSIPKDSSSELFTESYYNTKASKEEKGAFDRKAHGYLKKMYGEDQERGLFQNLDYHQYLNALSGSFFEERINLPREEDPKYYEEVGNMFFDTYEGDFDQFKKSAMAYKPVDEKTPASGKY